MSYLHTIAWLHKTFPTRQRTTELLRPELEEHTISPHDYELATRFLPGPNVDWHLAYGAGTSAAMYGYGLYFTRPRWNAWRLRLASVAAFFAGSTYGIFRQFLVHYRFANSLENPRGFIMALNHVDEKLGGSGQMGFAFREVLVNKPDIKPDIDHANHARDAGIASEGGWIQDEESMGGMSESDSARPKTRWDEIRAANSPNTGQSSWDTIRQRHERNKLPDSSTPPSDSPSIIEAHERAAAQARFDALLEAERHRSQS